MDHKHYPEPVVGTFILNAQNQLFLMKSHKWSNLYVVPGGHIEIGETIEEAIVREVKEETNLEVNNPDFICLWEFIQEKEFHEKKHMLFLDYVVHTNGNKAVLNEEAEEYLWVERQDIFKLPLEKYTKLTLEQYADKIFG